MFFFTGGSGGSGGGSGSGGRPRSIFGAAARKASVARGLRGDKTGAAGGGAAETEKEKKPVVLRKGISSKLKALLSKSDKVAAELSSVIVLEVRTLILELEK